DDISGRVAEINNQAIAREQKTAAVAAERAAITRQGLIDMARDVYLQAKEVGQTAAAVAALKEIGVLSGIRIERSERGQPGEFEWLERLSTDGLRLLADGKLDIETYRQNESRTVN